MRRLAIIYNLIGTKILMFGKGVTKMNSNLKVKDRGNKNRAASNQGNGIRLGIGKELGSQEGN